MKKNRNKFGGYPHFAIFGFNCARCLRLGTFSSENRMVSTYKKFCAD